MLIQQNNNHWKMFINSNVKWTYIILSAQNLQTVIVLKGNMKYMENLVFFLLLLTVVSKIRSGW